MDNVPLMFSRRRTNAVRCGSAVIGGGSPISVQTMTKTDTRDVDATVSEIRRAVEAGADIVRVAVPDAQAAEAFGEIRKRVRCPLVADIHFDYRLAIECLRKGADKVRVNPGNIGGMDKLLLVADEARRQGAAIRVGVNSGSLEKEILEKHGGPTPQAIVESACRSLAALEDRGFGNIVISLKSSSVKDTVSSYALMASRTAWPMHVGVTEAGPGLAGVVKSTAGISVLLAMGIGDTIRVSLTGSPVEEVEVGRQILQAVGAAAYGPDLISCPTCGRTQVDLVPVAQEVARRLKEFDAPMKVAVMGCPVNGPGEAREADVGVACGREGGIIFAHGQVVGRVPKERLVDALIDLVAAEARARRGSGS